MEIGSTFMHDIGELNLFIQHQQLQHCGAQLTHGQMRNLFSCLFNKLSSFGLDCTQNLLKQGRFSVQLWPTFV